MTEPYFVGRGARGRLGYDHLQPVHKVGLVQDYCVGLWGWLPGAPDRIRVAVDGQVGLLIFYEVAFVSPDVGEP